MLEVETARLVRLIQNNALHDGIFGQPIPGLRLGRFSSTDTGLKTFYTHHSASWHKGRYRSQPGRKSTYAAAHIHDPCCHSHHRTNLARPSPSEPYLTAGLSLEPQRIAEWALKMFPGGLPPIRQRSRVMGLMPTRHFNN
jgi:hypothetical protein